jgi:hypothetical protein
MKIPIMMTRALIAASLLAGGPVMAIPGGVTPGYVRVKVYEIRVAPNADCTGALTVYRTDSPSYQDWVNNPTIGSGAVPNGTYSCVMVRMSDNIHFTPSTTDPSWTHSVCLVGSDYVIDVAHDEIGVNPDGTTQNFGSPGTENIAWLYVRTGGGSQNGNAWSPADGLELTSPLVVNGDGDRTVVMDFTNQVSEQDNGGWECGCEAPSMGFR